MTMTITVFILILLLHTVTYSQFQYDACWKIESDPPCNDDYYANNLGCHYDTYDISCMCRITNDIIDVIYLVDISTSAVIEPANFSYVSHLIQDVTNSTLVISSSTEIFNQLILYDINQYPQTPNINAESIDINQYTRTQLNDLQTAINNTIQTFENSNLYGRRVLVIFNGQMQKDYTQDDVDICPVKATLDNAGITVIVVSYTPYDATENARNLTCLVDSTDPSSNDAYNMVPFSAIVAAPEFGWNGFPIEAKLSWDLCETARPVNTSSPSIPPSINPSINPSISPSNAPIIAPTFSSISPTITPTPKCLSVLVTVLDSNDLFSDDDFNGLYLFNPSLKAFNRPIWQVDDKNIQYSGCNWIIRGVGGAILSYITNDYFIPENNITVKWIHSYVDGIFHTSMHCIQSYSPTILPTISPSKGGKGKGKSKGGNGGKSKGKGHRGK